MRAQGIALSALTLPLLLLSGCATTLTCPKDWWGQKPEAVGQLAEGEFVHQVPAEKPHALLKFKIHKIYHPKFRVLGRGSDPQQYEFREWHVLIDRKYLRLEVAYGEDYPRYGEESHSIKGPYRIAPGRHEFKAQQKAMLMTRGYDYQRENCGTAPLGELSGDMKEGEEYTLELSSNQAKFYRSAAAEKVASEKTTAAVLDCVTELDTGSYLDWMVGRATRAEDLYVKGCGLHKGGNYAAALRELDQAVALRPNLDVAHVYRGMTLIALEKPQEAIQALDKGIAAARLAKRDAAWFSWPRFYKGVAFLQMNRLDQAVTEFNDVVTLKPDASAYFARAQAYFTRARGGLFPEEVEADLRNARSDIEQAVKLRPRDSRAWGLKAGVHFMLGEREQGCQAVKRACELGDCRLSQEFTECR